MSVIVNNSLIPLAVQFKGEHRPKILEEARLTDARNDFSQISVKNMNSASLVVPAKSVTSLKMR